MFWMDACGWISPGFERIDSEEAIFFSYLILLRCFLLSDGDLA